jgi:cellulose synthase/poly-beta-1,6-N-acetylglucosamine synthase-like glycosyltransferase
VLIPGYKEDKVIIDVASDALKQNYPTDAFDVVIIADQFQPETLDSLRALPIKLIEVKFEQSTKSKALNAAMAQLSNNYDVAVILDADNLMEPEFLNKINQAFANGFSVVQGHRVAKNMNTAFAVLDAISEELNNTIFRKGHRVVGLSSALIGSGMAFDYQMFKARMAAIKAIGGFDKELELTLLRDGVKIEYLNDALVYDEKVQKIEVFENQRKRWLSAQFVYFRRFFAAGLKALLFKGNIDFFDKVYQMISPPRVLLLGFTLILTVLSFAVRTLLGDVPFFMLNSTAWFNALGLVVLAFAIAIPIKFYNKQTLSALMTLPKAFLSMFLSLFKLKGANKKFIHTQHGTDE